MDNWRQACRHLPPRGFTPPPAPRSLGAQPLPGAPPAPPGAQPRTQGAGGPTIEQALFPQEVGLENKNKP